MAGDRRALPPAALGMRRRGPNVCVRGRPRRCAGIGRVGRLLSVTAFRGTERGRDSGQFAKGRCCLGSVAACGCVAVSANTSSLHAIAARCPNRERHRAVRVVIHDDIRKYMNWIFTSSCFGYSYIAINYTCI